MNRHWTVRWEHHTPAVVDDWDSYPRVVTQFAPPPRRAGWKVVVIYHGTSPATFWSAPW